MDLKAPGQQQGTPIRFISSTRNEWAGRYSPDGKRFAFVSARSGAREIWVCGNDGANPAQLTSFGGVNVGMPEWSPDGQNIAFCTFPGGRGYVYIISADGGVPRRLATDPPGSSQHCWSRHGWSIYFVTDSAGSSQIYVAPATGGKAVQITKDPDLQDLPHLSPDGEFLYCSKGYPGPQSIWRVPVEGGEGIKILDGVHAELFWIVRRDGIYFFTKPDEKSRCDFTVYEFATGKTRKILTIIQKLELIGFDISPDGRAIIYAQEDESGSDLMLVENFQ